MSIRKITQSSSASRAHQGLSVNHASSVQTETTSLNPKSRIEKVLHVGLQNERAKHAISPSKPIGLFGGVQRTSNENSNELLETLLKFSMYAAEPFVRDGKTRYRRATSYKKAQGVLVKLEVGCFYRPQTVTNWDWDKLNMISQQGLLTAQAHAYLFTDPLRELGTGWKLLADKLEDNLRLKINGDPNDGTWSPPRVERETRSERIAHQDPYAHLLAQGEADEYQRSHTHEVQINGVAIQTFADAFSKFNDNGFEMKDPNNDSIAYTMPNEFEQYLSKLMPKLHENERIFGTMCVKGTIIEISFEQDVNAILSAIESTRDANRFDDLSKMMSSTRF